MTPGSAAASDRGGGWVAAQFALMLLIVVAVVVPPDWPEGVRGWLRLVGIVLAAAGLGFAFWAGRTMGRALTPFPEPAADATLVESGPFAYVRHPVYAGALLLFTGWALVAGPIALGLTALLGLLWVGKTRAEESRLAARFPGYGAYQARVRWRLIPGVW